MESGGENGRGLDDIKVLSNRLVGREDSRISYMGDKTMTETDQPFGSFRPADEYFDENESEDEIVENFALALGSARSEMNVS